METQRVVAEKGLKTERSKHVTDRIIDSNIGALRSGTSERTFQDHFGYRDLIGARLMARDAVRQRLVEGPSEGHTLNWEDGHKVRQFAVLDPIDELIHRLTGDSIVQAIETALHPNVTSSRLANGPPGWKIKRASSAHKQRRRVARKLVESNRFGSAILTDVTDYYRSVDRDVLRRQIIDLEVDEDVVDIADTHEKGWVDAGGHGIPIGPELSGPVGNLYLSGADQSLVDLGTEIVRYTDDYLILIPPNISVTDVLTVVDSEFGSRSLGRSEAKTRVFDDPDDALRFHDNATIQYLRSGGRRSRRSIHRAFADAVQEDQLDVPVIRFLLGALRSSQDPYALQHVVLDHRLWDLDPRRCSEYMAIFVRNSIPNVDVIFERVARLPDSAVKLNILRSLRSGSWGEAEGKLFEKIGEDATAHPVIRAEATGATTTSPLWDEDKMVDIAMSNEAVCVRRAATGTFALVPDNPTRERRLNRILGMKHSTLSVTAAWALGRQ